VPDVTKPPPQFQASNSSIQGSGSCSLVAQAPGTVSLAPMALMLLALAALSARRRFH
jgi:MYXO-CTERM domain-containing protein